MSAAANRAGRRIRQVLTPLFDEMEQRLGERTERRLDAIESRLVDELRRETADLARMLRIQADADDEVASTLGRTLARLSAEVESLAAAAAHLDGR